MLGDRQKCSVQAVGAPTNSCGREQSSKETRRPRAVDPPTRTQAHTINSFTYLITNYVYPFIYTPKGMI